MRSLLSCALLCSALALWAAVPASAKPEESPNESEKPEKADKDGEGEAEKSLNTACPVSDEESDPEVTFTHEGRTIAFCCEGCIKEFKKEPAKFVAKLEEQEKEKEGKSGEGAGDAEGEGEAEEAALNTKCPVSDDDIHDPGDTVEYDGRTIAFCCSDCVKEFNKNPDKFVAKLEKEKGKSGEKSDEKKSEGDKGEDA
jgi:YHS domain-containing protein